MSAAPSKRPMNADPATVAEAQKAAPAFAHHIRDLMMRGHKVRDAVVMALKAAGMYELIKEKNPGAIDRIVKWFDAEMLRLEQARDEGKRVIRGVVVEEVDARPEDVASGRAFGETEGVITEGLVKLA